MFSNEHHLKGLFSFVNRFYLLGMNRWLAAILCVYAVRGIGGLKNACPTKVQRMREAQRNVKPDLSELSHVTELN
jgi:membrane protein insertase Oxa1/YidC/SpoIIIJ